MEYLLRPFAPTIRLVCFIWGVFSHAASPLSLFFETQKGDPQTCIDTPSVPVIENSSHARGQQISAASEPRKPEVPLTVEDFKGSPVLKHLRRPAIPPISPCDARRGGPGGPGGSGGRGLTPPPSDDEQEADGPPADGPTGTLDPPPPTFSTSPTSSTSLVSPTFATAGDMRLHLQRLQRRLAAQVRARPRKKHKKNRGLYAESSHPGAYPPVQLYPTVDP